MFWNMDTGNTIAIPHIQLQRNMNGIMQFQEKRQLVWTD